MYQKKCPSCQKLFAKRGKESLADWKVRRFCSGACRTAGEGTETWPTERVEQLKKLWHEGLSAGVIAQRWGISRSAVIGKVHRLGLPGRATSKAKRMSKKLHLPIRPPRLVTQNPTVSDSIKQLRRLSAEMREVPTMPLPVPPEAFEGREASRGVALLELDPNGCRWPVNESSSRDDPHLFCNAERMEGKSYCEAHFCRAYVKPHRSTKRFVMKVKRAA